MEREDCGVLVFFTDSLNSVCADIAGTDSSQGESHMSMANASVFTQEGQTVQNKC